MFYLGYVNHDLQLLDIIMKKMQLNYIQFDRNTNYE